MGESDGWMFVALAAARALQFVGTALACGGILFSVGILAPALSRSGRGAPAAPNLSRQLSILIWAGLALLLVSALCVLALKASDMSGAPLSELASGGVVWTVLTETAFGHAWSVRLALLLLLLFALLWMRHPTASSWRGDAVAVLLALSFAGALAWSGHANAGSGPQRSVHLAADVLHLIAAAAWLGSLLPLAFVLRHADTAALSFKAAQFIVLRFSRLGVAAVATLVISGVVNTVMIIDRPSVLVGTPYGRVLILKLVLFLIMLGVAAVNWQRLTPRLSNPAHTTGTFHSLRRNCLVEAVLGGIILSLVGALGILSPEG